MSTGTASIRLGSGTLDRLRDVEWWLVEPKRDETHGVRVNPGDFAALGFGQDGPWGDAAVQAVATEANMTAVTAQHSTFAAKVTAERVRRGPWNGVLILEGGQKDGKPVEGGH